MYCILEDNRGRLSYCPENWIKTSSDGAEVIYWPKSNQNTYIDDPDSEPVLSGANKWLVIQDKVKRRHLQSKAEANHEMDQMLMLSRTETDTDAEDKLEENGSRLRHRKVMTKGQAKSMPKFIVSQTPPNSALLASVNSSPQTPTNSKVNQTMFQQTPSLATPPSTAVSHEEIVNMQSVFNNIMPTQDDLNILSDVSKFCVLHLCVNLY